MWTKPGRDQGVRAALHRGSVGLGHLKDDLDSRPIDEQMAQLKWELPEQAPPTLATTGKLKRPAPAFKPS